MTYKRAKKELSKVGCANAEGDALAALEQEEEANQPISTHIRSISNKLARRWPVLKFMMGTMTNQNESTPAISPEDPRYGYAVVTSALHPILAEAANRVIQTDE